MEKNFHLTILDYKKITYLKARMWKTVDNEYLTENLDKVPIFDPRLNNEDKEARVAITSLIKMRQGERAKFSHKNTAN